MLSKNLKQVRIQLLELEERGLRGRVKEYGSDTVTMTCAQLDAIDDAIKLLDPELNAKYANGNEIELSLTSLRELVKSLDLDAPTRAAFGIHLSDIGTEAAKCK